jgi:glycosyltransferase involved in cell wall biosynthesis
VPYLSAFIYCRGFCLVLDNKLFFMKFLIIAAGFNCDKYVMKCVHSINRQTYRNFQAIIIDDGSTDNTGFEVLKYTSPLNECIAEISRFNYGAARRRYDAIKEYATSPEDVIVLIGLDDELKPEALERIKKEYDKGAWMTYGNWVNQHGKGLPAGFLEFDEATHRERNYRRVKYRSTAVNTFKRFLFDQLTPEDFKYNGEWVKATTESNLMFSCLEMCGKEKIGVINDKIYLYNQGRPDNARSRFGSEYQNEIYNDVINRPKKNKLTR